jgi:catechol 2,3-dioxygenase-like lactoylglutathione lyase family enzyme
MEMRIELIPIPVTDVDRAIEFYTRAGFNLDHDHTVSDDMRFVQLTPPGSHCSIVLGKGMTPMAPGSVETYQMVVPSAAAAREDLVGRGIDASDVQVMPWGSFVFFADPDGNKWALQELPPRP